MTPQQTRKRFGVGLSGNIATGKSTVAETLKDLGVTVIDADQLSRDVTSAGTSGLEKLVVEFGDGILKVDGTLDRQRLGNIVFLDSTARHRLQAIVWPEIHAALDRILAQEPWLSKPRPFIYEAALLIESGAYREFSEVWITHCSPKTQLDRLMAREGVDRSTAEQRILSQVPFERKKHHATQLIHTDCDLLTLKNQVAAYWRHFLGKSGTLEED